MGRNYYCDYCEKSFNDQNRKKHASGLPHQVARKEYYAQFKSAKNILRDESHKKPCSRFPSGQCQFGALCRFSHYTPAQIQALRQQVQQEDEAQWNNQSKIYTRDLIDEFMRKREQRKNEEKQRQLDELFKYPEKLRKIQDKLPPSLQPLNVVELSKVNPQDLKFFGE